MAIAPIQQTNGTAAVARPFEAGFVPLWQAVDELFRSSFLMPSQFFGGWASYSSPSGTNLYETGESYVVQLAMPGMKPDSITCKIEQGILTCSGEAAISAPEGANAVWQSFGGPIKYQITLPTEVDAEQAQANYENGVLTITVPKAAHARVKKIPVVGGGAQS
ncbi:MAG TPA: Hsp20/alpha crystallin family protein [Chloroflexota bacterium]|nr:Hsp20/alpha crystallin family protein [Chloroflexota bacterium]